MARAYELIPRSVALTIVLAAASTAAGAAGASDGARRTTNSFTLVHAATAPQVAPTAAAPGTGVASGKPIIVNPYHVPLIQNAGSLTSGR